MNPDHNRDILDGKTALRASPDADENGEALDIGKIAKGPPRNLQRSMA
jgi:UV DNA damage endonuclease